jgi:hypothetical protein
MLQLSSSPKTRRQQLCAGRLHLPLLRQHAFLQRSTTARAEIETIAIQGIVGATLHLCHAQCPTPLLSLSIDNGAVPLHKPPSTTGSYWHLSMPPMAPHFVYGAPQADAHHNQIH